MQSQTLTTVTAVCTRIITGWKGTREQSSEQAPWKHCLLVQRHSRCWYPHDATSVLNEQHLPQWFNKGNFPHFYSSAIKLHKRKEEIGFGFSLFQHNSLESCNNPSRCGKPTGFYPAGTLMAMCHQGLILSGQGMGLAHTHILRHICYEALTHSFRDSASTSSFLCTARPVAQGIGSKYS